jgi:hypothetical protein
MTRKQRKLRHVAVAAAIALTAVVWALCGGAAEAKSVPIEGMQYNVNASLADNLQSLVGKRVYITLDSGKTLSGRVKAVGNHLVHLEKLDGKDYFDALILLEDISAIDAKFREIKR